MIDFYYTQYSGASLHFFCCAVMARKVWPDLFLGGVGALYPAALPFQAAINVAAEVRYEAAIRAKLDALNISCYTFAMTDDGEYNLDHTDEILDLMHLLLTNKVKVLVHCFIGVSRSAAVVIRYLVRFHQHTYDTALEHINASDGPYRPNTSFEKQLRGMLPLRPLPSALATNPASAASIDS